MCCVFLVGNCLWVDKGSVNRLLGSATLDRLRHNAYCLELDGQSYRTPQLLPKACKTVSQKLAEDKRFVQLEIQSYVMLKCKSCSMKEANYGNQGGW